MIVLQQESIIKSSPEIEARVKNNTKEEFVKSVFFKDIWQKSIVDGMEIHREFTEKVLTHETINDKLMVFLADRIWQEISSKG